MRRLTTQVLIAGGGPVGLTLAMDLAWRGIEVLVLETRAAGRAAQRQVQSRRARARWRSSAGSASPRGARRGTAGRLSRTTSPSAPRRPASSCRASRSPAARDRYTATGGPDTWWPTPEPPHRINQIYLEPILFAHAVAMPRRPHPQPRAARGLHAGRERRASRRRDDLDGGEPLTVAARYLIGCDGGALHGAPQDRRHAHRRRRCSSSVQSTFIRAPALLLMIPTRPAWANTSLNPRRSGNMFAIDGRETWLIHNYMRPDETDSTAWIATGASAQILGVGPSFPLRDHQQGGLDRRAAWSPTGSATGASSSAATRRISGCRTRATA